MCKTKKVPNHILRPLIRKSSKIQRFQTAIQSLLNLQDDCARSGSFKVIRQEASSHILKAYEQNAKRYNLRAKQEVFNEGQEIT